MICRGRSFLDVVLFGFSPIPSPLFREQVVSLSQSSCVSHVELTDGRGWWGGGGAGLGEEPKSYDSEKGWSSLNYSILSETPRCDGGSRRNSQPGRQRVIRSRR
jgi:hypothetical protein